MHYSAGVRATMTFFSLKEVHLDCTEHDVPWMAVRAFSTHINVNMYIKTPYPHSKFFFYSLSWSQSRSSHMNMHIILAPPHTQNTGYILL